MNKGKLHALILEKRANKEHDSGVGLLAAGALVGATTPFVRGIGKAIPALAGAGLAAYGVSKFLKNRKYKDARPYYIREKDKPVYQSKGTRFGESSPTDRVYRFSTPRSVV